MKHVQKWYLSRIFEVEQYLLWGAAGEADAWSLIQPPGELIEMLLDNFLLASVFGQVLAQQADGILTARPLGRPPRLHKVSVAVEGLTDALGIGARNAVESVLDSARDHCSFTRGIPARFGLEYAITRE